MSVLENAKIYKIINNEMKIYIGSTKRPLNRRFRDHINEKDKSNNTCCRELINGSEKIILIKQFDFISKKDLLIMERKTIDEYKSKGYNVVNKTNPIVTIQEYKDRRKKTHIEWCKNNEDRKTYTKNFRENNKVKQKQYMKEYHRERAYWKKYTNNIITFINEIDSF